MDHIDDDFEWDIAKSRDCLRRRGFDFEYASRIFDSDCYYEENDERDYDGEERNICVGEIDERCFTVVYTTRKSRKRIISAWLAAKAEMKKYVEFSRSSK